MVMESQGLRSSQTAVWLFRRQCGLLSRITPGDEFVAGKKVKSGWGKLFENRLKTEIAGNLKKGTTAGILGLRALKRSVIAEM